MCTVSAEPFTVTWLPLQTIALFSLAPLTVTTSPGAAVIGAARVGTFAPGLAATPVVTGASEPANRTAAAAIQATMITNQQAIPICRRGRSLPAQSPASSRLRSQRKEVTHNARDGFR
jgi:hypothetical protein